MTDVASVDVYSDVVCPWCYIGKRKLEQALVRLGEQNRAVTPNWRTFQLNPDMPSDGMARKDYVAAKFGGTERAKEIYARVTAAGAEVGLAFQFDKIERQPNTIHAHRLIRFAGLKGSGPRPPGQDSVVEALFRAFFLEFRDIGDIASLSDIASAAGLDRQMVFDFLSSDDAISAVQLEDETARRLGISGVPFFIFGGKYAVSGAQPADIIFDAIQQASAEARDDQAATG
jgi:predicted DsbA family dithiol-disulfide isomerase